MMKKRDRGGYIDYSIIEKGAVEIYVYSVITKNRAC